MDAPSPAAAPPPPAPAPAPTPRRRFSPLRFLLKFVLWTVGVVIVLIGIAFGLLQTDFGRELVRDVALGALNDGIRGRVEVDAVGGLLPFDVTLRGVRIYDPEGALTLSVDAVAADVHPFALLNTTVHLSDIHLTAPNVRLLDAQGQVGLARAFEPRVPSPPDPLAPVWVVRLERIRLERGVIEQLLDQPNLAFGDTTVDVSLHVGERGLAWRDLVVDTHPEAPLPPHIVIRSDGELNGPDLILESAVIEAGPHRVALDGRLRLSDMSQAEVHLTTVEIDLDALPAALGVLPVHGTVELSGSATLADGRLTGELGALTPLGRIELQVGADTVTQPVAWEGTLRFVGLRPDELGDALPRGFEADGAVTVSGLGPLLAPVRFYAEGDLVERAPSPGGRLWFTAERLPMGADDGEDPSASGVFAFTVGADGLVVDPWLALFDQPDLAARLTHLTATGQLTLARGAPPQVIAGADFDLSARGHLAGNPDALELPLAFGSADLQWGGDGLPVGSLAVTVSDARFGDKSVAFADVSAELGRSGGDQPTLDGVVRIQEAVIPPDIAAGQLTLPLHLTAPDFEGPPTGSFEVEATALRAAGNSVGQLAGSFALRRAAGGVHVTGRFDAAQVATAPGARAARATGRVDSWLGWRGQLDGEVEVTLVGAAFAELRAAQLHAAGRVDARQGLGRHATLAGHYDARAVDAGGAHIDQTEGEFDVALDAGAPTGTVQARVHAIRLDACADGRACVVEAVTIDAGMQRGGKVAWDVRANQGGLELSLLGVAQLPLGRKALQIDLDRFVVALVPEGGGARETLVAASQVRWVAGGLVRVGEVRLVAPGGGAGTITARGTIDPPRGTLDLTVAAEGVALGDWLERYPAVAARVLAAPGDAAAAAGPDVFGAGLPRVEGNVNLAGRLAGTFAAPTLRATLTLTGGRLEELTGIALGATAEWQAGTLQLGGGGTWHSGGRFNGHATLPVTLTLAPFGLTWDQAADLSISLTARDADLTTTQRFLSGVGAGDRIEGHAVAGAATFDLSAVGSLTHPAVHLEVLAEPFSLGSHEDGRARFELVSAEGITHVDLEVDGPPRATPPAGAARAAKDGLPAKPAPRWPLRKPLVRVAAVLPVDVAELYYTTAPLALARARLRDCAPEQCRLDLQVGRMRLGETPAADFLRRSQRELEVVAQLHLAGPLSRLAVTDSRIEVAHIGYGDSDVVAWLNTEDNVLSAEVTLGFNEERAMRGSFVVPDVGLLALEPDRLDALLHDPRLRAAVFSDDMTSAELWGLNQGLGEIAATFLPDARAMVHLNVRGAPAGPLANAIVRLRNGRRGARRGDPLDRNIADDLRLVVNLEPARTTVALRITQDSDDSVEADADRPAATLAVRAGEVTTAVALPSECRVTPTGDSPSSFAAFARVDLGTEALLAGALPSLEQLPIEANLYACGFQLGRVARALGATFGPSRGRLDGRVTLTGTITEPDFAGDLVFDFQQLALDAIGFHRDRLKVAVHFADRVISLVPIHLEAKSTSNAADAPPAFLTLGLTATFNRMDARGIRLAGQLEMKDFPLLDTHDAQARVAADLKIGGSVARPSVTGNVEVLSALYRYEFGGRSIRPLGLPDDVTLVAGDPVPPEAAAVAGRSATAGARLDVAVRLHQGRVIIENEMMRLLPWTRDLHLKTVDGELAITGTIFIPNEKITLYGKVFRLSDDSRVVFTGDMSTDPQLLVSATYDISELDLGPIGLTANAESTATVTITGNARAPRLTLSSDPAMDESNIINVIVFDAPIGQGEGQDSAVRNQVANMVIGLATGSLSRFVTDQLPIDTFQLDTKNGDLTESRLTVGKRLAKNLFFRYRRNIGADGETESANEFSAEYRLGPVNFLGSYGDIGEFSLETNLRLHQ